MNLINQINNHSYLHLDKLIDEGQLKIELFVSEASSECWDEKTNNLDDSTENEKIEVFKRRPCKKYKIEFEDYAAYSISNESLTVFNEYERYFGNLFRKYSKSRFLDYLSVGIDNFVIENSQEKQPVHFGIGCLNTVVNVASFRQPKVEEIF